MKTTLALLLTLAAPLATQAPAERVTDINTAYTGPAAFFAYVGFEQYLHEIVSFGNQVAFTAEDGIHGVELWITDGTAPGTHLVADLCPGRCPSYPRALAVLEDQLFFVADDGVHGSEPFMTNGTAIGTQRLGDLWPGQGTSRIRQSMASSNRVYFVADSPGTGWELWATDGTEEGTHLVRDLRPGQESSRAVLLGAVGGTAILSAEVDGGEFALWHSDGTEAGTALVPTPLVGLPGNSNQQPLSVGGLVYFVDDRPNGSQVVRSDGTGVGTFAVATLPDERTVLVLVVWNDHVYFLHSPSLGPQELWVSDGTPSGTLPVATLPTGVSAHDLVAGANGLYFRGCDDQHGCEPWYSDGTEAGTRLVADIGPSTASGLQVLRTLLSAAGGGLVFFANDGVHGNEPWYSDGTLAGTQRLGDFYPGSASSYGPFDASRGLTRATVANRAFFWASTPEQGFELWSSDGTEAGTHLIRDVHTSASSLIRPPPDTSFPLVPPIPVPGGLMVFASDSGYDSYTSVSGTTGREPWFVSHASGAPIALGDLEPGPGWVPGFSSVEVPGGAVFLRAGELWSSDGTPTGTHPISAAAGLDFDSLARLTDRLLLIERTTNPQSQHLRSLSLDLTQMSPRLYSEPGQLFIESTGASAFVSTDTRLLLTAGTPESMRVISNTLSRGAAAAFTPLSANRWLFVGSSFAEGLEPWQFEASASAPEQVLDLWPGPESGLFPGNPRWESFQFPLFAPIGGTVLFGADDGIHGFELWASDGTAPGTRMVVDLRPGAVPSDLERLTAVGSRAFFIADDGVHGRELWVSDGTALGTRMVRDLAPGPGSAVPQELTAIGNFLVFNAWTPERGRELWISDGTEVGTRQLVDIAPGPASSSPVTFVAAGGWLYFTANDNVTGDELWRVPLDLLQPGTIFADGFETGDTSAWNN